MGAFRLSAYVIKAHVVFSSTRLTLEEDCFLVATARARVLLGAWQSRVMDNVRHNAGQFAKK